MTIDVTAQIGVSQFEPGLSVDDVDFKTLRAEIVDVINAILNGQQAADSLLFTVAGNVDISSDAAALANAINILRAESGVTDDLETITITEGKFAFIKADTGDTITIKSGDDNILTSDGNDLILSGNLVLMCVRYGSSVLITGGGDGYSPAETDDWNGTDPTTKSGAIDRLAGRAPYLRYVVGYEVDVTENSLVEIGPGEAIDQSRTRIIRYNFPSYDNLGQVNMATTGINALDSGVVANNTQYYIYVCEGNTGVGFLASTNHTTPTLPAGYNTYYRRIGMVRTDGSANLLRQKTTPGGGEKREVRYTAVTKAAPYQILDSANLGNGSGAANAVDVSSMVSFFSRWVIALIGCETASAAVDVFWFVNSLSSLIMPNLTTGHAFWTQMTLEISGGAGAAYGDGDDEDFSFYVLGYYDWLYY